MSVAGGSRLAWADLPGRVHAAVEEKCGSAVADAEDQAGGFSPGTAARLRLADGRRVFVKAVASSLNPTSPGMYRDEARALAALPPRVRAPSLLWTYDDRDWIVLGIKDIDGRPPQVPWRPAELDRVLTTLDDLGTVSAPDGFCDVRELKAEGFTGWRTLAASRPADLSDWERRNLDRLAELEASWTDHAGGDALLHFDLRADNILLSRTEGVYLVDWAQACRGAAWVDLVLFLVSVNIEGTHDVDSILASRGVPKDGADALICAFAGFVAKRHRLPAPPGLPTLRAFQREYTEATVAWLRRRTDW
jgi:phosphotransferase family enzyme